MPRSPIDPEAPYHLATRRFQEILVETVARDLCEGNKAEASRRLGVSYATVKIALGLQKRPGGKGKTPPLTRITNRDLRATIDRITKNVVDDVMRDLRRRGLARRA